SRGTNVLDGSGARTDAGSLSRRDGAPRRGRRRGSATLADRRRTIEAFHQRDLRDQPVGTALGARTEADRDGSITRLSRFGDGARRAANSVTPVPLRSTGRMFFLRIQNSRRP